MRSEMKRWTLSLLLASIGMNLVARADILEGRDKTVSRTLPEEPGFQNDTEYKKKYEEIKAQLDSLQQTSDEAKNTLNFASGNSQVSQQPAPQKSSNVGQKNDSIFQNETTKNVNKQIYSSNFKKRRRPTGWNISERPVYEAPASGVQIFNVSQEAREQSDSTMTVLPAGSFVRARVVAGVEAVESENYPALLQLEYAFTGPNKSKIDLSNCFVIAKGRADLSIERVIMDTEKLSCVKDNGEHYSVPLQGYIAGADSSHGATGTYMSKQGQVLLAAVLANIAKNAGDAVAAAQQTTNVVAGNAGAAASATNVTGDQAAFIAGKSVVDAGTLIATWYLEQAKKLKPAIAVGSGQSVHIVILDTVRVPILHDSEE